MPRAVHSRRAIRGPTRCRRNRGRGISLFHSNGKFVYLLHELNGDVAAFTYEAKGGAWDEIQRTTALPEGFTGKPWAADIHVTPDGRFLYASERTTSTITAYKVDATSRAS